MNGLLEKFSITSNHILENSSHAWVNLSEITLMEQLQLGITTNGINAVTPLWCQVPPCIYMKRNGILNCGNAEWLEVGGLITSPG